MTDGTAGERRMRPATLRALGRTRRATREIGDDLLSHLPDLGDAGAQRAVDAWVDQGADTMQAMAQSLEDRLLGPLDDTSGIGQAPPARVAPTVGTPPARLPSAHPRPRQQ